MYTAMETRKASDTQEIIVNVMNGISAEIEDATKLGKHETYVVFDESNNYKAISKTVADLYKLGYNVKVLVDTSVEIQISWEYLDNDMPLIINSGASKEDTEIIAEMIDKEIGKIEGECK